MRGGAIGRGPYPSPERGPAAVLGSATTRSAPARPRSPRTPTWPPTDAGTAGAPAASPSRGRRPPAGDRRPGSHHPRRSDPVSRGTRWRVPPPRRLLPPPRWAPRSRARDGRPRRPTVPPRSASSCAGRGLRPGRSTDGIRPRTAWGGGVRSAAPRHAGARARCPFAGRAPRSADTSRALSSLNRTTSEQISLQTLDTRGCATYPDPRQNLYRPKRRETDEEVRRPDAGAGDRGGPELGPRRARGVRPRRGDRRPRVRRDERVHPRDLRPRRPFGRVARRSVRRAGGACP